MAIDIPHRIKQILVDDFGVPQQDISFTAPYDDLSFDSLMLLELALILKSDLGVSVSEREIAEAGTLNGFVALLESKAAA